MPRRRPNEAPQGVPHVPRVLVIDEDRAILHSVRQALAKTGVDVSTVRTASRAPGLVRQRRPDLLLVDLALLGDRLRSSLTQSGTSPPLVLLSSAGPAPRDIIEAMKLTAVDLLPKPLDFPRLRETVLRILTMQERPHLDHAHLAAGVPFVAECPAMHEVVLKVSRAASRDVTVLLTGEAGTGKTHLARIIHRHDARAAGRLVEFDPTGKPAERLEGELFGYELGTGRAYGRRLGWLERSQGGALVLDTIDALPLVVQTRLVTVFERRCVTRVGGERPIPLDVRLLAATRRDLELLVAEGRFRPDLYHSLHDVAIALPPLRQRLDDLPRLAQWFLRRITQRPGTRPVTGITHDAVDLLRAHRWPGNLWELESVLRRAAWQCRGNAILPEDLPEPLRPARAASATGVELPAQGMDSLETYLAEAIKTDARQVYAECVALFDRYICRRVLTHTRGNQSHAARILGITRRSLRTKVRRFHPPA